MWPALFSWSPRRAVRSGRHTAAQPIAAAWLLGLDGGVCSVRASVSAPAKSCSRGTGSRYSARWPGFRTRSARLIWLSVGLFLSVTVLLLQQFVLRTPDVETPFEKLLVDTPSRIVIALFGVTLGPVIEELLFRGFLQPVLVPVAGVFPGILLTAATLRRACIWSRTQVFGRAECSSRWWALCCGVVRHVSGSTAHPPSPTWLTIRFRAWRCYFKGIQPNHRMIETIQWTPEGVVMIDQTRLPSEERYVTCRDYREVAKPFEPW